MRRNVKYYINIINIPVSVLMPGISSSIQHDLKYYMNIFEMTSNYYSDTVFTK